MNCILKQCAHADAHGKSIACVSLGQCGAAYALERSKRPGGYEVVARDNKTIAALRKTGLVSVSVASAGVAVVRARHSTEIISPREKAIA